MFNYRLYKCLDRTVSPVKSSRVALVRPKTPREIYDAYVVTGEIPRIREGGVDTSLDVPVVAFGDVSDASSFVDSVYAELSAKKEASEKAQAEAKAAREKEMAEAYAKLQAEMSHEGVDPV